MRANLFVPLLSLGLFLSFGLSLRGEEPPTEKPQPTATPLEELRLFAEIFGRIKSDYVEPVDDRTLLENAIRGMLSGLDPHSSYLNEEEYRELQVGTSGEFGGLGIEVGVEDGFLKVIAPIDDTPAQRAGIQAGDLIVRIDGKPTKGMDLSKAVQLMRGKPGTKIKLMVLREGKDKPFSVEITRAVIHIASVKHQLLQPGYGYVRIAHFQSGTTDDLLKAVDQLIQENEGKQLKGLVLDLRNNPGGVLNGAVGVSDAFLTAGLIVSTKGRLADAVLEFQAGPDDILDGAPLVVLVNGGSASASEIVAGALQDHQRAIILGTRTFGKGSVQTIVPINHRRALKLTTARYYTPSGRSIQAQGIEPDIRLYPGKLKLAEQADGGGPLREADLVHHLENPKSENADQEKPEATQAETSSKPAEKAKKEENRALLEDYQINEALNILRALSLYNRREN